ncbi:MAG: UDP-N-acetylmuramate dehydrogenase [Acidobacteria bacterium]|nr:UDP-N-acetylmuramate dehydrogenase [Acidobacteriota bacterium]
MAPLTSLHVGGPARWFAQAATTEDVAAACRWCADADVPLCVLGGGTNMVVADRGADALVLQVAIRGVDFGPRGSSTSLRLGAGEPWDDAVSAAVSRDLAGLECLSGIPGSAGGTPVQNVGAYGQDVAQTIVGVTAFDRASGEIVMLNASDCQFGYRTSRFKSKDQGRFIVCEVLFELRVGPPTVTYPDVADHLAQSKVATPVLQDVRNAVLAIRKGKGMVIDPEDPDTRSVGSFFLNPVVDSARHAELGQVVEGTAPGFVLPTGQVKVPAAWLIEQSGFGRGYQAGAVGLSAKHPLAIVNRGAGTAREIVALARTIKQRVIDRFGIWLRAEPVFVGFGDDPDVAFVKEARS